MLQGRTFVAIGLNTLTQNVIQIIEDSRKIQSLTFELIKSAQEEILGIFSTPNAFHRQERAGALTQAKELGSARDVKIRILTPLDEKIQEIRQPWKDKSGIDIRAIEQVSQTRVSILVVDRKYSLAVELKDDSRESSLEAIGLATYSNSPSTVLSYTSIFETLWLQGELYEKLRVHDRLQNEFISMAAHELRTPIQPVLALSQHLLSDSTIDSKERQHYLEIIARSASRLQQLTEDILDITRIETNSLKLNLEVLNINEIILECIKDAENQLSDGGVILQYAVSNNDGQWNRIKGDRRRLAQVMTNLLTNSIKFTPKGNIEVSIERKGSFLYTQVRDTGTGIDPEIMSNLFSKFITKSSFGTGLGLFISKGIVEAHGGAIWAENNPDGKGASVTFKLPLMPSS
jgi:two-component system sensor histidine kinase VicK